MAYAQQINPDGSPLGALRSTAGGCWSGPLVSDNVLWSTARPEASVQADTEPEPTYSWTITISGNGSDFATIADCYGRALTSARAAGHSISDSSITAVDYPAYEYSDAEPF